MRGLTAPCGHWQGDYLPLSAVPESFLPYLEGEEPCPAVRYGD
eukprot:COSAG01_NODE_26988_length_697_cov_1.730769_1_plen_42_part_01